MFDMLDKPLVWIPVYWPGLAPGEKEGDVARVVEHRIDVLVEILEREELEALFFASGEEAEVDDFTAFKRVASDWRKIVSSGQPVPFTDDNIRALLRRPNFPQALQTHYLKACAGKVEIREGNSESSPPVGRAVGRAKKAR